MDSYEDNQEARNKDLKVLIDSQIKQSYMPEYQAEQKDADGLGQLISKYFEWDGLQILEAFYIALEDSNYHTINEKIADMIENEKNARAVHNV